MVQNEANVLDAPPEGRSYLSQSDLRAYFGLGEYPGSVDVEVRMPGGRRWEWRSLPSGRLHVLELTEARLAQPRLNEH